MTNKVRTRFAPSPTGDLHLGSARTALFNWLFARHHNGEYLLRIEDTDRARSTKEALETILQGLAWLGINHDGEIISQHDRAQRHREVVDQLLKQKKAYYCYCSPEELSSMRDKARVEGRPMTYDGRWRDRDPSQAPSDVLPVVRLKSKQHGVTHLHDLVQGSIDVQNDQLDDMILLRSDGTPTYMLAVVVDDHDMEISHIIRGDDHLTNAFRQLQIYDALGWNAPQFAHIPLIHGTDGAKLSKRHGATNISDYAKEGVLPEAMCNYLLRLGWSHGDDEIMSMKQAIEWFNIDAIGKSPARFDMEKLMSLNAHYIRETSPHNLVTIIEPSLEKKLGKKLSEDHKMRLEKGMPGLQQRAKTLNELVNNAWFYIAPLPLTYEEKAQKFLKAEDLKNLQTYKKYLQQNDIPWTHDTLLDATRSFAEKNTIKMRDLSQTMRAALTGSTVSPSVFNIMEVLGQKVTYQRFEDALQL